MKIKVARLAIVASLVWNILLFSFLMLDSFGERAPLSVQLAKSQGILLIGTVVLALHFVTIRYSRQESLPVLSKTVVVIAFVAMLILVFLTGFSIGLLMLPSLVLLFLASILFLTNEFSLNKQK